MPNNPTDTNQASGDELRAKILTEFKQVHKLAPADYTENCTNVVMNLIRTEKLKLLDKFENDCKYNYTTFGNSEKMLQVSGILKRIEAERTKLEAEL